MELDHRWSPVLNLKAGAGFPPRLWVDPWCLQTISCTQLGWGWRDVAHLALDISMLDRFLGLRQQALGAAAVRLSVWMLRSVEPED